MTQTALPDNSGVLQLSLSDQAAVKEWGKQLYAPKQLSHKGQNGKVLVIGGSELFHSSLIWAAKATAMLVDMVHVTSPAGVNQRLVTERIKSGFLDGIVIGWDKVGLYVEEDEVCLIGPGMPRTDGLEGGELATKTIVDGLLSQYGRKKWVIDGGALQEVDWKLLGPSMVITPHQAEYQRLIGAMKAPELAIDDWNQLESRMLKTQELSALLKGATVITKGYVDVVADLNQTVVIEGGDVGLTKGGTGDILAGLVAGFYVKNAGWKAAAAASLVVKQASLLLRQNKKKKWYLATEVVDKVGEAGAVLFD